MLTLIANGTVYTPESRGTTSVLLGPEKILKVGSIDRRALDELKIDYDYIDAAKGVVIPGLIDPHEHLLGGSGERGFSSQSPEIQLGEIVQAGITTVVGCLGVDTTMKTMPGLLARAKGLHEEGITAFIYTGGYNVPPTTILSSVREDLLFITEVIGAGEIAIADERAMEPSVQELAKLVTDAHVGGMLSGKAGVTHFHVGPSNQRLTLLRSLLREYDVRPEWLYPTHIERSEALVDEAIALTKCGCTVDIDTVEKDLPHWLRYYLAGGGDPRMLTVSSDASITGPANIHEQIRQCVHEHGFRLEQLLPMVSTNTARVLKLAKKGCLEEGKDADVVILAADSLEILEVFARGKHLVRSGRLARPERFLEQSDREVHLIGSKSRAAQRIHG
jgi:beta-aspartyl-dipeptidase (metallo-type)